MTIVLPEETVTEKPIAVRVLERAALIIEEHGHCCSALMKDREGQPTERNCRINDPRLTYCELGAIWRAGFEFGLLPPTLDELDVIAANSLEHDDESYFVIGRSIDLSRPETEGIHVFNDEAANARESATHLRRIAQEWQSTRS